MRKYFVLIMLGLLVGALAAPVLAETVTVTGDVVSLSCYYQDHKNIGKAGMLCANATVKYIGDPVGLVASNGTVYQLEGPIIGINNAKAVPLLGHKVTITGETRIKAHMPMLKASEAKILD
jgi:hypothetical protein